MFLKFGTAGTDAVEDVVSLQQSVSVVQGKILIGVLQITAELPSVLRLNYPVGFNKLLVAARVLLVDLFSTFKLDCVSPLSLHARFVIVVLLPPAGIAIVQLLRLWNDYKSAEHKLANSNKAAYRSAFIIVLLYPLLCRTCFRMFACQKLGEEEGWHPDDFTIACDSSVHTFFKVMASVGVIVYPIGIPLVFMVLLQYDKRNTDAGGSPGEHLNFLRSDYKPDLYYYECVTLLQKLLITGLAVFVEQGSIFQAFCCACISFGFFANVVFTWPYAHVFDNILKSVAEAQLFLTLLIRCANFSLPSVPTHPPPPRPLRLDPMFVYLHVINGAVVMHSIILRTELSADALSKDDYGNLLILATLAAPSVESIFALHHLLRFIRRRSFKATRVNTAQAPHVDKTQEDLVPSLEATRPAP